MAKLTEIREFLDAELRTAETPDYGGAMNGLQVENSGEVTKVVAAVDASLPVIEKAVAAGADLLIVHHGLFWAGAQSLTGAFYRKIKAALDAGMAVYSSHLPLDVHPDWGNNALLARALGVDISGRFMEWKGLELGFRAEVDVDRDSFLETTRRVLGSGVHVCPGGPERVRRLGIVTGGAGSEVPAAAAAGIDTFLTGEGPHWSYPLAEELGVNLIYGGHYATETFGVCKLGEVLAERFGVDREFVDHPTGL